MLIALKFNDKTLHLKKIDTNYCSVCLCVLICHLRIFIFGSIFLHLQLIICTEMRVKIVLGKRKSFSLIKTIASESIILSLFFFLVIISYI